MKMNNILRKTTINLFYKNDLIKFNEIDNYVYGLEVLLLKIAHTSVFILFGILNKNLLSLLLFLYLFSYIRARIHGYHANTRIKCLLLSLIMCFILCLGLVYKFPKREILLFMNLITTLLICKIIPKSSPFLFSLTMLVFFAPNKIINPIFFAEFFSLILYYLEINK